MIQAPDFCAIVTDRINSISSVPHPRCNFCLTFAFTYKVLKPLMGSSEPAPGLTLLLTYKVLKLFPYIEPFSGSLTLSLTYKVLKLSVTLIPSALGLTLSLTYKVLKHILIGFMTTLV